MATHLIAHAQNLKSHDLKAIKGWQVTKILSFAMTAIMQQQIITMPADREGRYKLL